MKTLDKPRVRVLDHLLGREKSLSFFFPNSLYVQFSIGIGHKKLQNKILVPMKTFDKPHIRVFDHLLGREKHLSVFFSEQSLLIG